MHNNIENPATFNDGQIQLYCGDWFTLFPRIEPKSVDLILTDPPYGGVLKEKQSWDSQVDLLKMEMTFDKVLKENGLIISFCNLPLMRKILDTFIRFSMRSHHVWHKSSAMPVNKFLPLPDAELILVMKRTGVKTSETTWNPTEAMPCGKPYFKKSNITESPTRRMVKSEISVNKDGSRWITTVLTATNKPNMELEQRSKHPCQKPEYLLRQLIRTYSNEGDLVLDPFVGSGSTLISAYKENRRSIGFEREERYYNEAKRRINEHISQLNFFLDSTIESEKKTPLKANYELF